MNLRFEKFEEKHIPIYYAWRNDPEVASNDQSGFIRPMGYEEVESWSARMVEGLTFVAYDGEVPLGTCAFMNPDYRNRHAELAIVIGNKDYWSKGYGTEIMKKLLEWGFEGLNLNRLYLHVFSFNKRAIGLYEKMGFKEEGRLRAMIYRDGHYHDLIAWYAHEEYLALKTEKILKKI